MSFIVFLINIIKLLLCYVIKRKKIKIKEKIMYLDKNDKYRKFIRH